MECRQCGVKVATGGAAIAHWQVHSRDHSRSLVDATISEKIQKQRNLILKVLREIGEITDSKLAEEVLKAISRNNVGRDLHEKVSLLTIASLGRKSLTNGTPAGSTKFCARGTTEDGASHDNGENLGWSLAAKAHKDVAAFIKKSKGTKILAESLWSGQNEQQASKINNNGTPLFGDGNAVVHSEKNLFESAVKISEIFSQRLSSAGVTGLETSSHNPLRAVNGDQNMLAVIPQGTALASGKKDSVLNTDLTEVDGHGTFFSGDLPDIDNTNDTPEAEGVVDSMPEIPVTKKLLQLDNEASVSKTAPNSAQTISEVCTHPKSCTESNLCGVQLSDSELFAEHCKKHDAKKKSGANNAKKKGAGKISRSHRLTSNQSTGIFLDKNTRNTVQNSQNELYDVEKYSGLVVTDPSDNSASITASMPDMQEKSRSDGLGSQVGARTDLVVLTPERQAPVGNSAEKLTSQRSREVVDSNGKPHWKTLHVSPTQQPGAPTNRSVERMLQCMPVHRVTGCNNTSGKQVSKKATSSRMVCPLQPLVSCQRLSEESIKAACISAGNRNKATTEMLNVNAGEVTCLSHQSLTSTSEEMAQILQSVKLIRTSTADREGMEIAENMKLSRPSTTDTVVGISEETAGEKVDVCLAQEQQSISCNPCGGKAGNESTRSLSENVASARTGKVPASETAIVDTIEDLVPSLQKGAISSRNLGEETIQKKSAGSVNMTIGGDNPVVPVNARKKLSSGLALIHLEQLDATLETADKNVSVKSADSIRNVKKSIRGMLAVDANESSNNMVATRQQQDATLETSDKNLPMQSVDSNRNFEKSARVLEANEDCNSMVATRTVQQAAASNINKIVQNAPNLNCLVKSSEGEKSVPCREESVPQQCYKSRAKPASVNPAPLSAKPCGWIVLKRSDSNHLKRTRSDKKSRKKVSTSLPGLASSAPKNVDLVTEAPNMRPCDLLPVAVGRSLSNMDSRSSDDCDAKTKNSALRLKDSELVGNASTSSSFADVPSCSPAKIKKIVRKSRRSSKEHSQNGKKRENLAQNLSETKNPLEKDKFVQKRNSGDTDIQVTSVGSLANMRQIVSNNDGDISFLESRNKRQKITLISDTDISIEATDVSSLSQSPRLSAEDGMSDSSIPVRRRKKSQVLSDDSLSPDLRPWLMMERIATDVTRTDFDSSVGAKRRNRSKTLETTDTESSASETVFSDSIPVSDKMTDHIVTDGTRTDSNSSVGAKRKNRFKTLETTETEASASETALFDSVPVLDKMMERNAADSTRTYPDSGVGAKRRHHSKTLKTQGKEFTCQNSPANAAIAQTSRTPIKGNSVKRRCQDGAKCRGSVKISQKLHSPDFESSEATVDGGVCHETSDSSICAKNQKKSKTKRIASDTVSTSNFAFMEEWTSDMPSKSGGKTKKTKCLKSRRTSKKPVRTKRLLQSSSDEEDIASTSKTPATIPPKPSTAKKRSTLQAESRSVQTSSDEEDLASTSKTLATIPPKPSTAKKRRTLQAESCLLSATDISSEDEAQFCVLLQRRRIGSYIDARVRAEMEKGSVDESDVEFRGGASQDVPGVWKQPPKFPHKKISKSHTSTEAEDCDLLSDTEFRGGASQNLPKIRKPMPQFTHEKSRKSHTSTNAEDCDFLTDVEFQGGASQNFIEIRKLPPKFKHKKVTKFRASTGVENFDFRSDTTEKSLPTAGHRKVSKSISCAADLSTSVEATFEPSVEQLLEKSLPTAEHRKVSKSVSYAAESSTSMEATFEPSVERPLIVIPKARKITKSFSCMVESPTTMETTFEPVVERPLDVIPGRRKMTARKSIRDSKKLAQTQNAEVPDLEDKQPCEFCGQMVSTAQKNLFLHWNSECSKALLMD